MSRSSQLGSNGAIEMTSKIVDTRNGYNGNSHEVLHDDLNKDDTISDKFPQKRIKSGRRQVGMMEKLVIDAALSGDVDEMESLLDDGANPNVIDEKGKCALHWIVSAECTCTTCSTNGESCLRLLLLSPTININIQDANGDTPLHLAARSQSQKFAELLLAAGADISIKNNGGEKVVAVIAKKLPDTMIYLLNESITVDQYEPHNDKCVLQIDFGPVVGHSETVSLNGTGRCRSSYSSSDDNNMKPRWQREMKVLACMLGASKFSSKILVHPVISIFLEQKWRRVSKFFWMSLICYVLWVILYTSYIINVYLINCPCHYYSKTSSPNDAKMRNRDSPDAVPPPHEAEMEMCSSVTGLNADVIIIVSLTAIMAIGEIIKMIVTPKMHLRNWMSFGTWVLIILVFLTTLPNFTAQKFIEAWQYQTASFTVLLAWAFILNEIGRFPSLGRFVEIFGRVLKNFGFFMLTYASLFTGFALALSILFPGNTPFSYFGYSMLKVFVMLAGELDYQEMFYGDNKEEVTGPVMGHILYALFVIVCTIVLMNLLIGMTVSDIQGLQKEAEFLRVSRLIIEIFNIENFIFSSRMPGFIGNILKGFISVVQPTKHSKYNLNFTFRPNCPEDNSIPLRLKQAALVIAAASYHEQRSSKCLKGVLNRSDNSRLSRVSRASTSTNSSSSLETHSLDASSLGNNRKSAAAWSR